MTEASYSEEAMDVIEAAQEGLYDVDFVIIDEDGEVIYEQGEN